MDPFIEAAIEEARIGEADSYTWRMVLRNLDTGRAARGAVPLAIPGQSNAALTLDPPLLLGEDAVSVDLAASAGGSLSALFGYDAGAYAPLLDEVPSGLTKLHAALRLTGLSASGGVEMTATVVDASSSARTEAPVSVLKEGIDGTAKVLLVEVATGELKRAPGVAPNQNAWPAPTGGPTAPPCTMLAPRAPPAPPPMPLSAPVKSFVQTKREEARFTAQIAQTLSLTMRRDGIMAVFIPVIRLLTFSAAAAVLWYGGKQVIDGAVSPGDLFAFVLFAGILIGPFSSAARVFAQIREAQGATERVFEILDTHSEVGDERTPEFWKA